MLVYRGVTGMILQVGFFGIKVFRAIFFAEDLVLGGHAPNHDKQSPCRTAQVCAQMLCECYKVGPGYTYIISYIYIVITGMNLTLHKWPKIYGFHWGLPCRSMWIFLFCVSCVFLIFSPPKKTTLSKTAFPLTKTG